MTKAAAKAKLQAKGYEITFCMSGAIIARKGQRSYQANTLNALIKQIF
jgi:hypothetical protein